MDENERIVARVVLEILGKPKEYVEETLKNYVDKIRKDETLEIIQEDLEEAEEKEGYFSAFAELEIEFPDSKSVSGFCIDYMPSSIEILEPSKIQFNTNDLSDFFNDLQSKLHKIDMIAKSANLQNKNLRKNSVIIMKSLISVLLEKGPHTLEELSQKIGLKPISIEQLLKEMVENKKINFSEGKYSL